MMRCDQCGKKVERGWKYCPSCGARIKRFSSLFERIFERMERELREFDREFSRDFEVFDLSPFFGKGSAKGFSIKITQHGGRKPEVSIKTFGDVDRNYIERELKRFDIDGSKSIGKPSRTITHKIPERTEEPKTNVKRIEDEIVVEIELPGVEKEDDIYVSDLESSIEVKAFTKDKAYFKILTKPENSRITKKRFKNGKLTLYISTI